MPCSGERGGRCAGSTLNALHACACTEGSSLQQLRIHFSMVHCALAPI